jgi:hypothetical protein
MWLSASFFRFLAAKNIRVVVAVGVCCGASLMYAAEMDCAVTHL